MADSSIAITAGSGTTVDTRTEATNGHHRQVVVLGDPSTNAGVAPVDATAGLKVDLGADNDITGTVTANLSATDNAVLDQIELNTDPLLVVGGGTEATAIRVTLASDSTGVLSVDDNGGALTVDGTVTANLSATDNAVLDDIAANQTDASQKTQIVDGAGNVIGATSNALDVNIKSGGAGDGAILDGANSAVKATVLDYTNSNPLAVRLSDANGDYVAAGAGTQYTEDDAAAANPVGSALMMVRDDALSGQTTTDGDNVAARGTDKGELYVKTVDSDALLTTIDSDTGGILTAVQLIDNAVSGAGFNITQLNGAAVPTGAGTEAAALRVTLATDSTGVVSVDDNGGTLTVDGTVAVSGTVAVTQSGTWDEVGINDSGNNISVDWAGTAPPIGAGLEATALRVTLATDSTGVVSVDDNGGALTVDGTVTANAGTNLNTSALALEAGGNLAAAATSLGNIDNSVDGNYLNVNMNIAGTDVVSGSGTVTGALRVELPTNGTGVIATVGAVTAITNALPAGTNAIGKLAANSGVDIGDVDVASLPALAAGTNAIGKIIPPDYDVTSHTAKAVKYYTSAGAATDGIIWSPAAGKRWHVTTLFINISAAATITIEDDLAAGDNAIMKMELAANSGVAIPFGDLYPLTSGEDAADLLITTSAGNVYVTAVGYEI